MFDVDTIIHALQDENGNDTNYFVNSNNMNINGPQVFTYETFLFDKTTYTNDIITNNFSITFKFLDTTAITDLTNHIDAMLGRLYKSNQSEDTILAKKAVFDNFVEFIKQYNNLVFIDEILANEISLPDTAMYTGDGIPEGILPYLNFEIYNPNYDFESFYNEAKNEILDIIYDIGARINENLTRIVERINETVIQLSWLTEDPKSS